MIPGEFLHAADVNEDLILSLIKLSGDARTGTEGDIALAERFARTTKVISGRLESSANGRFVATWKQGIRPRGENLLGVVFLADMREGTAYDLNVTCPMEVAVYDVGDYVVAATGWENFRSSVVCRDLSGNVRWQQDFNVNIAGVGISATSGIACVATLLNPNSTRNLALLLLQDGLDGTVLAVRERLPGGHRKLVFRGSELYVVYPATGESGPVLWTE